MSEMSRSVKFSRILVAVSGSVASVLTPHYIYLLRRELCDRVDVVATRGALRFITRRTLRVFSGNCVVTDRHSCSFVVPHVELTRAADAMVVMPASANIIAKAAAGLADDVVSTAILACRKPTIFCPAMNEDMWRNNVVQRNVRMLRELGRVVLDPVETFSVADGKANLGGMAEFSTIASALVEAAVGDPSPE